ncbi:hypothetical protein [Parvibaculum sp.]|uniref:hypothetical protein n=1 Tax=Parvibaculum sp. TaxID=2024848 RepID=UPI001D1DF741|nr:hypothetical protein [Parvibaculum sp.]MBX3490338.1 hypothetical protein [Parvibaculum sp.]
MRFIFGVLIASVSFAGVALADPQANLYSNTVVITSAAGVSKAFVNEDHSYTTTFPDGKVVKGSWAVQGDEVCYTQTDPAPAETDMPICVKNEERQVGDTWEAPGADGKPIKVTLQEGR